MDEKVNGTKLLIITEILSIVCTVTMKSYKPGV